MISLNRIKEYSLLIDHRMKDAKEESQAKQVGIEPKGEYISGADYYLECLKESYSKGEQMVFLQARGAGRKQAYERFEAWKQEHRKGRNLVQRSMESVRQGMLKLFKKIKWF